VTSFADGRDQEVREAAILSLGASRRTDAVEWLIKRFDEIANAETRRCMLLSLATSRTDAAIQFLLGVIRNGSAQTSVMAVSAMEINRADHRIQEEIERALQARATAT
jgi:Na+/H+-translocating membrane pyrophosphatase